MNNVIKLLKSHRSIRKYSEQPINQDLIKTLVEAGQSAATSSFIQACTVIQICNQETRKKLCECAGNQEYVINAPVFLVFCADMQRHRFACDKHGASIQAGYTEQFLTASLDCAFFAQNLVVAAESMGLGTCYIGAIRNRIAEVDKLLGLPDLVYPVVGLCLGYPAQDPELKPRLPLPVILKQEIYDDSSDTALVNEYDDSVRQYYKIRTDGSKDISWSEQIAEMLKNESRPHMLSFLKKKGYLLM